MELWSRLSAFLLGLIDKYDDQAIFLLMFLEESGVPLPTPGDLVMVLAGYRVGQGQMNLLWVLFLIQSATIAGASVLYWLAARGGRPLIYRYGRYIHLDRAKLDRAEGWICQRTTLAVFLGRVIPGLRNVTVIAAGVFGVPYWKFILPFSAGSFLYILFFVLMGMFLGPYAMQMLAAPRISARAIFTAVLFLGLSAFLVVMYRRASLVRHLEREPAPEVRRLETSALAGFLATLQMALGVNVTLYVLALFDARLPESALITLAEVASARFGEHNAVRLAAVMVLLTGVSGVLWAVLYTHVAVPLWHVPPWMRGLLFSALPLAFSVLVVLPVLGAGPFGFNLGAGLLPLAGEVFRNVVFGLGLAASYSLLRVARQRPARASALEFSDADSHEQGPGAT